MIEAGYPDVVIRDWSGVVAKAGTPPSVVDRLNAELSAALRLPESRERLAKLGIEPELLSAGDFAALIGSESARWGKLVQTAGLKP
jgi:tripartite-type tricarboxylate transporter receptor subunit TctC